jgi:hypothetical protein
MKCLNGLNYWGKRHILLGLILYLTFGGIVFPIQSVSAFTPPKKRVTVSAEPLGGLWQTGFAAYVDARNLQSPYDIGWVQLDILCLLPNGVRYLHRTMFHDKLLSRGYLYRKSFPWPKDCDKWIRLVDATVSTVVGKSDDPWPTDVSVRQGAIGGWYHDLNTRPAP